MHLLRHVAVTVACCLLAAPLAWAEDEPKPLEPKAEPAKVELPFAMSDIAPADDARPEGWSGLDGSTQTPEAAPTTSAFLALTKQAGIATAHVQARCMPLMHGEGESKKLGVVGWLAVDQDPSTLTPALADAAKKQGWHVKFVGVPHRVLVTWASDAEASKALQAWQVEAAVRGLCMNGWASVVDAGTKARGGDQAGAGRAYQKGLDMIGAAGRTEPRASIFHALQARLVARQDAAASLDHHRKALAKDAPIQAPDRWIVISAFQAGQALLLMQKDAVMPEAVRILTRGVAAEEHAEDHFMRFGNRYNLACAYARGGEKDKAFEHLEESLRFLRDTAARLASQGGAQRLDYAAHFKHAKDVDTDMDNLRSDERWAKLMATYDPSAPAEAPKKAPK